VGDLVGTSCLRLDTDPLPLAVLTSVIRRLAAAGVHASRVFMCASGIKLPRRDSGVLEFVVELPGQVTYDAGLTGERRDQNSVA